jgi:hypothetical protein
MIAAAAGAASAANSVAPPYDPDPNAYGTVTFYDATGKVVTSGDGNNPESPKYAVANVARTSTSVSTNSNLAFYGPQPLVNTGLWNGIQLNGNGPYPITAAGTPTVVSTSTFTATAMAATSQSFFSASKTFLANTAASGLQNTFQIRVRNAGGGATDYAAASITVDPVTGHWQQVFPVVPILTPTTTGLTVSPASPVNAPANPTLTATVAPTTIPGSVQFFDGATSLGTSPVTAGVATLPLTAVPAGTKSYTATFTPTDAVNNASSTSSAVPYVVSVPKPTPAVALTATSVAPTFGSPDTFTANVSPIAALNIPGTIQFFDNGTSLALAGATDATGMATITTSALTVGPHSVTATFVPTDLVTYNGSTSPVVTVNVQAVVPLSCSLPGSQCTDAQAFIANVPAGSIVISTPYTAVSPFNLGTLVLNAAGTQYSTPKVAFGSVATPAAGVTITDTRAGGLGWTASLQSSSFTIAGNPAAVINAGNLGFTEVAPRYITGNALAAAPGNPVVPFDNAASLAVLGSAAAPFGLASPRTFATAANGAGSVYVTGNFTLNAPSSVPAGAYGGTVTFTIA